MRHGLRGFGVTVKALEQIHVLLRDVVAQPKHTRQRVRAGDRALEPHHGFGPPVRLDVPVATRRRMPRQPADLLARQPAAVQADDPVLVGQRRPGVLDQPLRGGGDVQLHRELSEVPRHGRRGDVQQLRQPNSRWMSSRIGCFPPRSTSAHWVAA
jgi:hypothetical protein